MDIFYCNKYFIKYNELYEIRKMEFGTVNHLYEQYLYRLCKRKFIETNRSDIQIFQRRFFIGEINMISLFYFIQ